MGLLDQLATGRVNLAQGVAGIVNQKLNDFEANKLAKQAVDFKKQQLDISQGRFDLESLASERRGKQQIFANALATDDFNAKQNVRKQEILTAKTARKLSEANLSAKELATIRDRGQAGGIVGRSLLQTYPGNELQQQANFEQAKARAAQLGVPFPSQYPGEKALAQFVRASDVALQGASEAERLLRLKEKFKAEQRVREDRERSIAQRTFSNALDSSVPNHLRPLVGTLTSEQISDSSADLLSQESLLARRKEALKARQATSNGKELLATIDDLEDHPGLSDFFNTAGFLGFIPSTDASNFKTKLKEFDAKKFQTFVSQLQGLGSVSNSEGDTIKSTLAPIRSFTSAKAFMESLRQARKAVLTAVVNKWITDNPNIDPRDINTLAENPDQIIDFQNKYGVVPHAWNVIAETLLRGKQRKVSQDPSSSQQNQRRDSLPPPAQLGVTGQQLEGSQSQPLPDFVEPLRGGTSKRFTDGTRIYTISPEGVVQEVKPPTSRPSRRQRRQRQSELRSLPRL